MRWIKVEVKLPQLGERVLFSVNGFVGEGYLGGDRIWYRMTGYNIDEVLGRVLAWMPLPEPFIKTIK
jgi:hypothetical protein